ncbi:hypothetical protein EDB86DRAFT_2113104 [Lactarius hatsudake]|nr:hypothetical protein EDB86DRAFT_2113104 [Lactarius hatsudake]
MATCSLHLRRPHVISSLCVLAAGVTNSFPLPDRLDLDLDHPFVSWFILFRRVISHSISPYARLFRAPFLRTFGISLSFYLESSFSADFIVTPIHWPSRQPDPDRSTYDSRW